MTEKISITIIKVSALTLLASIVLIMGVLYDHFTRTQYSQQKNELELAAQGVALSGMDYFDGLVTGGYRITWINQDGSVIFDSKASADNMENHTQRQEFAEALETGYGQSDRSSATLSEKTFYSAKRLPDGTVLRVSSTHLSVMSLLLGILQPILVVAVLAIILSIVLARSISKKTVDPINNLDLENPLSNDIYGELSPLLVRIDKQNKKIEAQIDDLKQKNQQISYVTENVSDGIIMLDENGTVISANKRAKELLFCTEGNFYLDFCRNFEYKQTVETALGGKSAFCMLKLNDDFFRVYASATKQENEDFAVFLFISDVIDEEKNQVMRREFTANVSHELKTPLASIMGTAEIIQSGIAKPQDVPYFAGKIHEEAERLLALIQDIIKLSRLDEGSIPTEFSRIALAEVCRQVKDELSDKAKRRGISLDFACDNSEIQGILPLVHEMVFNLCDNAIAYNRENGSVSVEVLQKDKQVLLSVRDTGIGIPQEDLPHVFERFYRVDKSHSKETGGTGLGLSIAKHGAELHGAEISVESKVGQGTKFQIAFKLPL